MKLLKTIKEKYQILIFSVINVVLTLAPVVNLLVREKHRIEVAIYIGATIVVGLTIFPFYYCCMSPTMVKLRSENVHAKTFGRTVYGCWVWLSFAGSTEMAVYSYMLEDHKYVAWIIAIVLQLIIYVQFVLFSRLSVTPRVISFACLFLTTARLFMPFPMFFAILFTNNYVPAFILLFAFAYLLSAVGFVETVPPMKRWEYYTVAPCLYRAASTNGKTRREKYVAKGKRSVEDHKDPTAIKIVQIADPHLGAVTSAKTLRTFCEEVVEKIKPDLILLTGDMLTTEAYRDAVEMIQDSLAPLKPHKDIVYAAYGNHDHEALLEVTEAWEKLGFHVLNDESTTVEIRGMKIQIVGVDYRDYNDKTEGIMKDVFGKIEFLDDAALRIVLLHDPTSFKFVPDKNCLVLSGHTHGGIAGIPGVFSLVTMVGVPDNGLWRKDSNIVYVNRGQGNRSLLGNMLTRLFITSEKSILTVKTQMDEIV